MLRPADDGALQSRGCGPNLAKRALFAQQLAVAVLAACCSQRPPAPTPVAVTCEEPITLGAGSDPCLFFTPESMVDVSGVGWPDTPPNPIPTERTVAVGGVSAPLPFDNGVRRATIVWSATEADAGISFQLPVPLVAVPGRAKSMAWTKNFYVSECRDPSDHAVSVLTNEFRDESGNLIALVGTLPTRGDGGVVLPPSIASGISIAWTDTGCARRPNGTQAGGLSVSIDGGAAIVVAVGARAATTIDGTRYCVMVSRADRAPGDVCDEAKLVIYREDFFQRLDP